MDEARDEMYCHLMARRSAATAALRLGLEKMSEEALDTLASALLSYLSHIGQTLAIGVEASGRSSAHVNILDCLRAVEHVTCPVVTRVHLAGQETHATSQEAGLALNGNLTTNNSNNINISNSNNNNNANLSNEAFRMDPNENMSWKGLAAFCFGPQWAQPLIVQEGGGEGEEGQQIPNNNPNKDDMDVDDTTEAAAVAVNDTTNNNTGGKVGPSFLVRSQTTSEGGWHAPFPNEIPPFPVTLQEQTARPVHPLVLRTADSLHIHPSFPLFPEEEQEEPLEEQVELLDNSPAWTTVWGQVGTSSLKRKRRDNDTSLTAAPPTNDDTANASPAPPPAKKKKTSADTAQATATTTTATTTSTATEEEDQVSEDERHPHYVPKHFPSFPRPTDWVGPTVADEEEEEDSNDFDETDPTKPVPITAAAAATAAAEASARDTSSLSYYEPALEVRSALVQLASRPWGSLLEEHEVEVPPSRTTMAPPELQPQIVPLGRASGSRVSRILEGSMDS